MNCHTEKSSWAGQEQRPNKRIAYFTLSLLLSIFVLSAASLAYGQRNDLLGSREVILRIRKSFKLSSADIASLAPLIKQENVEMLTVYLRFSGDQPEYSDRLWTQVIELRRGFDARSSACPAKRRPALAAARRSMERRLVTTLVEDYVDFLARYLDLSDWQFDELSNILDLDRQQKEAAVNKHLGNFAVLYSELEVIAGRTDRNIKRILSAEQLQDYKEISEKPRPIAV